MRWIIILHHTYCPIVQIKGPVVLAFLLSWLYLDMSTQLFGRSYMRMHVLMISGPVNISKCSKRYRRYCKSWWSVINYNYLNTPMLICISVLYQFYTFAPICILGAGNYHDTQGVNSANVFLNAKSKVWVETQQAGRIEGDCAIRRYTTFSGHLLYTR